MMKLTPSLLQKNVNSLPKHKLLLIKRSLERYFLSSGVNIFLLKSLGDVQFIEFRDKIHQAIEKQLNHIATVDKISHIVGDTSKVDRNLLIAVGVVWLSIGELLDHEEDIGKFYDWAGEKGGQSGLDKVVPDYAFDFNNLALKTELRQRAGFLFDTINKTNQKIISNAIEDGIRQGLAPLALTKFLRREISGIAKDRSELISETELAYAIGKIELEVFRRNGIEQHRWITVADERTCERCIANEGAGYISIGNEFPSGVSATPAHPLCYSHDTDVYTDNGWKNIKDVVYTDQVMSIDPDSLYMEWSGINNIFSYLYEGDMIHVYHGSYDTLVTPDHKIFVGFRYNKHDRKHIDWKLVNASDLLSCNEFHLLRIPKWKGFKIDIDIDQSDYARLMGYYLSEGSVVIRKRKTKVSYEISIAQSNEEKRLKIYEDLKNIPFRKIYIGKEKIYIRDDKWAKYLYSFGHSYEKFVPNDIKNATSKIINIFLEAYIHGDGSVGYGDWKEKNLHNSKEIVITTSSKRMADDIGELMLKSGSYPRYNKYETKGKIQKFKNGLYKINNDTYTIRKNRSEKAVYQKNGHGLKIKKVQYKNMVYGITLNKNHVMLVRRNGKIAWSGNCRCYVLPKLPIALSGSVWTGN